MSDKELQTLNQNAVGPLTRAVASIWSSFRITREQPSGSVNQQDNSQISVSQPNEASASIAAFNNDAKLNEVSDTLEPAESLEENLTSSSCLFVVQCSSEKDNWADGTRALAFISTFIRDGVFYSLFLFDSRFGMSEYVPLNIHTVEHLASFVLFYFAIAPFTCAFINRYGFRYCLFFGSLMTICWAIFMWLFDSTFTTKTGWILAALGGAGTGVIQTTFTVLLSLLYNMSRPAAHLLMHLGSFAGIIVVPPLTEYIVLFVGWRTASFFHFIMLLMSLLFWILVAIPVPQKIEIIDDGPVALNENSIQSKAMHVAKDVNNLRRNDRLPTVWNTIGNRELRIFPFKKDTPLFKRTKTLKSLGIDRKQRLYIIKEPEVYLSTLRDFFNVPLIGSRPLYRDDVLFTGHVYHVLENEMKDQEFFYPLLMTRIMTLDDLEQELNKRYKCWTTALSRPFITLFMPTIWYTSIKFILLAAAEFFIHSARFAPFLFLKGPPGSKTSAETMVTLIAGGIGLLAGRAIGYIMHETSSLPVPIYTVSITLMANGLCLFLSATTELKEILPYFLLFGLFFGYYNSVQNALLYNVFPVHKINNVYGQISLVRAVASFVGIIVAVVIVQRDNRQSTERVYIYAGLLMMAAGTCVGILQAACNCLRNNCSSPLICDSIKRRRLSCSANKKMAVCPPMVAL